MFRAILLSLRPRQWLKNFLIFAALLFSGKYGEFDPVARTAAAFAFFCLLSSGAYLLNDASDVARDRLHPTKRLRPVAAGVVPGRLALFLGLALMAGGVAGCFLLNRMTGLAGVVYVLLASLYTSWLKNVVLLDVLVIAGGFVVRAVAGALATNVEISPWLIVCTVQLALFLALGKRRCEIVSLGTGAANHRNVLSHYSATLLDQLIAVVTSSTVIAYSLYTISDRTHQQLGTNYMPVTIPFVVYGIFRYLYLIHKGRPESQPENVLLTDWPLLLCVMFWGLACFAVIVSAR